MTIHRANVSARQSRLCKWHEKLMKYCESQTLKGLYRLYSPVSSPIYFFLVKFSKTFYQKQIVFLEVLVYSEVENLKSQKKKMQFSSLEKLKIPLSLE